MRYTDPSYTRSRRDELLLRCLLVESAHQAEVYDKMRDMLGEARRARQVPVSRAANPLRRALAVTSILYDHAAVSGLPADLAILIGECETPALLDRYALAGLRPMPAGLVEGAAYGGLRDALDYLQACEWATVAVGWADSGRPYISVMRPCDVRVYYSQSDPLVPIRVEWDRTRLVSGVRANVTDVHDVSDPSAPYFAVLDQLNPDLFEDAAPYGLAERTDLTARVAELKAALADGRLSGEGYDWRWTRGDRKGQPYIPVAVYGHPSRFFRNAQLAEGSLESAVIRTCAVTASLDAGFPLRCVRGLRTGTSADTTGEGVALNPGDLLVFEDADETRPGDHWEFGPGCDPGKMWQESRAFDGDLLTALGYPVDYTQTGGEPLAHEVEARRRAIRRWFGICRQGDAQLLERIAAVTNQALGTTHPETGYSSAYLDEVDAALAAAKPTPPPEPEPKEDPPADPPADDPQDEPPEDPEE